MAKSRRVRALSQQTRRQKTRLTAPKAKARPAVAKPKRQKKGAAKAAAQPKKSKPKSRMKAKKSLLNAAPIEAGPLVPAIEADPIETFAQRTEEGPVCAAMQADVAPGPLLEGRGAEVDSFGLGDVIAEAPACEPAALPLLEATFDSFSAETEFAPWQAPDSEDFSAPDDAESEAGFDDAMALSATNLVMEQPHEPPQPEPQQPEISFSPVEPTDSRDYLARARKAAQDQNVALKPQHHLFGLEFSMRSAVSLATASTAAIAMLAAGLVSNGRAERETHAGNVARPSTAGLTLAPPAAGASSPADAYNDAIAHLAAGRIDSGVALLQRAADAGWPLAQYRLAKLHETGDGVPRDLSLARQWAERAARGGNCRAMHDVGVYFARGEGAPVDDVAAFRWFLEAALSGVADSQYNLGILHQQGRGVSANPSEALFWFLVAARNRDVNAADRAVELAAALPLSDVERARARARAFRPRPVDAVANGGADACGQQESGGS